MQNKLPIITSDQCFSCNSCGQCCRRWYVSISNEEMLRLRNLEWGVGFTPPQQIFKYINGYPYLAHNKDDNCVFLDPKSKLCQIHAKFGEASKPLSCRGYPYNIASTLTNPKQISVIARFDCPAVRANHGVPINKRLKQIKELIKELHISDAEHHKTSVKLSTKSILLIAKTIRQGILNNPDLTIPERNIAMLIYVQRLEGLGTIFINDYQTLQTVMPSFCERSIKMMHELKEESLNILGKTFYRLLLTTYLRRDENMVKRGMIAKINRAWQQIKILCGRGTFGKYSEEHPDFPIQKANIFRKNSIKSKTANQDQVWATYNSYLDVHLKSLQFFGATYYNCNFWVGLRALVMSYPLILGAARYHAAANNRQEPISEDVEYAVGAIDHSFGRSQVLQLKMWRIIENYLKQPNYTKLIQELG